MTLNKMMIIGNLGADPELRYTPAGKAVADLRVAVNRNFRDAAGEWQKETQWFNVVLWDEAAERVAERFRKGHKVYAEGSLRLREWEAKDGHKGTSLEIVSARVQSLERRDPSEAGGYSGSFGEGSDAPPAAVPRGAKPQAAASEVEAIDVDDIPF